MLLVLSRVVMQIAITREPVDHVSTYLAAHIPKTPGWLTPVWGLAAFPVCKGRKVGRDLMILFYGLEVQET